MRTPAGETPPTLDVSLAATPAREDVANGLQILYGTRDGYAKDRDPRALIDGFEAVARLLRAALAKLSGSGETPQP